MITVENCVGAMHFLNMFSSNLDLSIQTRYKIKHNKCILQPIVDFYNEEMKPINVEIFAQIPSEITDQAQKDKTYHEKVMSQEFQEKIKPIVFTQVEVPNLIPFEMAEIAKMSVTELGMEILEEMGLVKMPVFEGIVAKIKSLVKEEEPASAEEITAIVESIQK